MSSKKWQIAASKGVKKIDSLFGPPKKKTMKIRQRQHKKQKLTTNLKKWFV